MKDKKTGVVFKLINILGNFISLVLFCGVALIFFHGIMHFGSGRNEFLDVYKEFRYEKDCNKVTLGNDAVKYYCTDGSTMYISGTGYVEWTSGDMVNFNGGWTDSAPSNIAW